MIFGDDAAHVITGLGGNDVMSGGDDEDVLIGGVGDGVLIGEREIDRKTGGIGAVSFFFDRGGGEGAGAAVVTAADGGNVLAGEGGVENAGQAADALAAFARRLGTQGTMALDRGREAREAPAPDGRGPKIGPRKAIDRCTFRRLGRR